MPKKFRINKRDNNLAKVTPDKAEEDAQMTSGLFAPYYFFDKSTRREHKIKTNNEGRWLYDQNDIPVSSGKYMYAVGKNGALYIGNPAVHSQFKAGRETQSAGWTEYAWSDHDKKTDIIIDNCSGHYIPTLSQFLSTLHGLNAANYLPEQFQIKLSKFTKLDYKSADMSFWEKVKENLSDSDTSDLITVNYLPEIEGFIFTTEKGQTISMRKEDIYIPDEGVKPNFK